MVTHSKSTISRFLELESAGGILLFLSALLAMVCANTPLSAYYDQLLTTPVEIRVGNIEIAKPLLLWINDGLMAIFFFLVGLELKTPYILIGLALWVATLKSDYNRKNMNNESKQ